MTPNNNLSILPFYLEITKQNHRKDYAFGYIFPLLTPDRKILPFQFIREHRVNGINSVTIRRIDEIWFSDITTQMLSTGLSIISGATYDVIKYHGKLLLSQETPEGYYYLVINDGVQSYYSEVFNIVRNMDNFLLLSYRDMDNLYFNTGHIDFTESFEYNLYIPTQVGRPDYEFEEQVDKRDGYQFIEKQISEKTYKFNFIAPEFILDAMRIVRMMDIITIKNKGDTYNVDQFLMTPKWQDGGYLASVEVEFQCDTVIKKIGKGYPNANTGDFNNDFNNDFKNS